MKDSPQIKLAISNIAWEDPYSEAVRSLLQQYRVAGIEAAPAKIAAVPNAASAAEIAKFEQFWQQAGISCIAFQALLFKQDQLQVLGDEAARSASVEYLRGVIELAGKTGAKTLVFGSPRNRSIAGVSAAEISVRAKEVFSQIGEICVRNKCVLAIEANPQQYNCDFVNTLAEARDLVAQVNHPGFGIHLDTGAFALNGESPDLILDLRPLEIKHFHLSDPFLAPVGPESTVKHGEFIENLRRIGYRGWVSIEMKQAGNSAAENLSIIETALNYCQALI